MAILSGGKYHEGRGKGCLRSAGGRRVRIMEVRNGIMPQYPDSSGCKGKALSRMARSSSSWVIGTESGWAGGVSFLLDVVRAASAGVKRSNKSVTEN